MERSMTDSARERRIRRALARTGHRLRKLPPRSRWFHQYGPYMIVDGYTNVVVEYGLPLDTAEYRAFEVYKAT
jgi:hypothetical protein